MHESLPSDFLTGWYAFLTFSWKRTPIFAVAFGSMLLPPGIGEKKKSSTQFIRGSPARKLPFSLLWSGERVFVKHGKTAAKTHMMLLTFYGNKTLCCTHVFE